jgi:hypothetical protein
MDLIPPGITGGARSRLLAALAKIDFEYRQRRAGRVESLRAATTAYLDVGWRQDVPLWVARWARRCGWMPSQRMTRPGIGGHFRGARPPTPAQMAMWETIPEATTAGVVAGVVADLLPTAVADPVPEGKAAAVAAKTVEDPLPAVVAGSEKPAAKPAKCYLRPGWLQEQLVERQWTLYDLEQANGPEHRTSQRILDGAAVQDRTLQALALALSVNVNDIPLDEDQ